MKNAFFQCLVVFSVGENAWAGNSDKFVMFQRKPVDTMTAGAKKSTEVRSAQVRRSNFTGRSADKPKENFKYSFKVGDEVGRRECGDSPGGWSCPEALGCPSDGDCDDDAPGAWQMWVDAINVRRCMHDAPPVTWSNAMYAHVHEVFKDQEEMEHSDCYSVEPPAGPAGENLAWASYSMSPKEAADMWYDEFNSCGPFPGCEEGANDTTGHFTAMVWNGVKEIGCTANEHHLSACQFKGADSLGCETPNMMGGYEQNVFEPIRTEAECEAELKKCRDEELGGADGEEASVELLNNREKKGSPKKKK